MDFNQTVHESAVETMTFVRWMGRNPEAAAARFAQIRAEQQAQDRAIRAQMKRDAAAMAAR